MKPLLAGRVLCGRFEVGRQLGAGGLAEVFAARDLQSGDQVAIKVLHAHFAAEPGMAERFRRELSVTRALVHPGIVRVFDLHEHEGQPFFSMELLRGETLAERVARGPLAPDEARRVVREACRALAFAHGQGVVHRDLKPQNVFLTGGGEVKLLDFGLARVLGQARLTATSTVMGTPGYIAPEVLRGAGADPRSDVYALGATWFELVTGRPVFQQEANQPLRKQEGPGPSPRLLDGRVPEGDDGLIRRALHQDPEQRFVDARQALAALDGSVLPAPRPPLPALVAGDVDIRVMGEWSGWPALRQLLQDLGAPASKATLLGSTMGLSVAQGASRESAQAFAEHCRAQGLIAFLRPSKPGGDRWYVRRPKLAAILAAVGIFIVEWALLFASDGLPTKPGELLPLAGFFAFQGALPGLGVWLAGLQRHPLLGPLPQGDPSLWRLVGGIQARVRALRDRVAALPPARRLLAADLIAAADQTERDVLRLATDLSSRPAASAPLEAAEAATLPKGMTVSADEHDRGVTRLLAVAAALDDALAAAGPGDEPRPQEATLSARLRALGSELGTAAAEAPAAAPTPHQTAKGGA